MSYTSGTPEAKSVNERYIRVAAIDIEIIQGTRNICTANTCKDTRAFPSRCTQELTMLQASDILRGMKFDQQPLVDRLGGEKNPTVQVQTEEDLRLEIDDR
jgi:hypothetical protein